MLKITGRKKQNFIITFISVIFQKLQMSQSVKHINIAKIECWSTFSFIFICYASWIVNHRLNIYYSFHNSIKKIKKLNMKWNRIHFPKQNWIEQKLTNEIISSVLFTSNDMHEIQWVACSGKKSTHNYIKQLNYIMNITFEGLFFF